MYGPPPECKSRVVGRRVSLRKCIRSLVGDASPGHDDDAHVPVLINPSVTGNQLAQPGSPARRLTVLSSVLSSADSGELSSRRRRGGGKVESVVGFPSEASFPRPALRRAYRLVLINFATGQHRPGDPCQLVGDGDNNLVAWGSCFELVHPSSEAAGVVLHSIQHSACAMDEQAAQIFVATLADAIQSGLPAG